MNAPAKTGLILLCGVLIIIAVVRITGSGEPGPGDREISRLFVCEECGALHPVDPDFIKEQYEAGTTVNGRGGPRFPCQSCSKPAARTEVMNFDSEVVRCEKCGKDLVEDASQAMKAAKRGDAKVDDEGRLTFKCGKCNEFTGHMVPRNAPVEME